jgi:hypothetical protein
MPYLDLPPLSYPECGVYLTAVMFYPKNPEKHLPFVEACRNTAMKKWLRTRNPDPKYIPQAELLATARGDTFDAFDRANPPIEIYAQGYPRDLLAGLLLIYVLGAAAAGEQTTIEDAVINFSTAGGSRASVRGRSRSSVYQNWSDFSPISHLSAVRLLLPHMWRETAGSGAKMAEFLAYAEQLRVRGEGHHTPQSKRPGLLDPAETWRVSEDVILPALPPVRLPTSAMIRELLSS